MKSAITTAAATLIVAIISQQTGIVKGWVSLIFSSALTPESAELIARMILPTALVIIVVTFALKTGHGVQKQRGRWSDGAGNFEAITLSREDLDRSVRTAVTETITTSLNGDLKSLGKQVAANTHELGDIRDDLKAHAEDHRDLKRSIEKTGDDITTLYQLLVQGAVVGSGLPGKRRES